MTKNEFSLMVSSHAISLRSHALNFTKDSEDANDLVQDTLLKATRFSNHFDEGTNIKGWLFVIMRNTFINNYRKNLKSRGMITQEEEITSAHLSHHPALNGAESHFAMEDISKALACLPKMYSVPFIKYFEGYKYHEIALQLNIPIGTVKTHIHEARLRLKKYLRQYKIK